MTADSVPSPVVSVVAGNPTAEELAALVTVLLARADGAERRAPEVGTAWCAPVRRMRAPVRPGPRAWRRAALPH